VAIFVLCNSVVIGEIVDVENVVPGVSTGVVELPPAFGTGTKPPANAPTTTTRITTKTTPVTASSEVKVFFAYLSGFAPRFS
jgi:hypothetical protein